LENYSGLSLILLPSENYLSMRNISVHDLAVA